MNFESSLSMVYHDKLQNKLCAKQLKSFIETEKELDIHWYKLKGYFLNIDTIG